NSLRFADGLSVGLVAKRTPRTGILASDGELQMLAALALGFVLGLIAGSGPEQSRNHSTRRSGEVELSGLHRLDAGASAFDDLDEFLQVARGAVHPVGMPGNHDLDRSCP